MILRKSLDGDDILGLKVIGGQPTASGRRAAYIDKVKRDSIADLEGHLKPGNHNHILYFIHPHKHNHTSSVIAVIAILTQFLSLLIASFSFHITSKTIIYKYTLKPYVYIPVFLLSLHFLCRSVLLVVRACFVRVCVCVCVFDGVSANI